MAFGDSDLAVFFGTTGVPVAFGTQSARGNLDEPGVSSDLVGLDVQDDEHKLEVARGCMSPMPAVGASITANGRSFKVRSITPLDDGATILYKLKAVGA